MVWFQNIKSDFPLLKDIDFELFTVEHPLNSLERSHQFNLMHGVSVASLFNTLFQGLNKR